MKSFLAICLMFPIYSFADNEANDYAFAYPLNTSGEEPLYKFEVPQKVYASLTQPEYSDIRIFNADNISVPYSLEHKTDLIEQESREQSISFFPMFVSDDVNTNTTSININTQQDGTVINVKPNNNTPRQNNTLLLDLSQFKTKPTIFTLKWADDQIDFNKVVSVMGSDDLATWNTISRNLSLSSLHFSEHHLIKNTINLPKNSWKYIRISWDGNEDLSLKSITGRNATEYLDRPRQTKRLIPTGYDDKTKSFFYMNNGRFPVDRLAVNLQLRNSLLNITVSSSNKKDGPWRTRHSGISYNLKQNGQLISPDTIKINTTNDTYWRITAETDRDNIALFSPGLELGWLPHTLTFVAQGNPPFIIAFGNRDATNNASANSVAKLIQLQGGKKISRAQPKLTSLITLGGTERLAVTEKNDVKVRTLTLWAVLILGLIILTMMALQLYKQISKQAS